MRADGFASKVLAMGIPHCNLATLRAQMITVHSSIVNIALFEAVPTAWHRCSHSGNWRAERGGGTELVAAVICSPFSLPVS